MGDRHALRQSETVRQCQGSRRLSADRRARSCKLKTAGAQDFEEMYPAGLATSVHKSDLSQELCGSHRVGHFEGVRDGRHQALPADGYGYRILRRERLPAASCREQACQRSRHPDRDRRLPDCAWMGLHVVTQQAPFGCRTREWIERQANGAEAKTACARNCLSASHASGPHRPTFRCAPMTNQFASAHRALLRRCAGQEACWPVRLRRIWLRRAHSKTACAVS